MDSPLCCNTLNCRVHLTESAVATTCCHIFCIPCSESSGPSVQANGNRTCPACHANLPNPHDAVFTDLNPTEDRKSIALIGLHPTVIMECAARALAFWGYQCSQEIAYQNFQEQTTEGKNTRLTRDMEELVTNANDELNLFNKKLSDANLEIERLKTEQHKLKAALINKTRVHHRTLELYDRLKRREMTATTKSATLESVDDVLGLDSIANRPGSNQPILPPLYQQNARPHTTQPGFSPLRMDYGEQQQLHNYNYRVRNIGSNSSNNTGQMMPPPPIRGAGFGFKDFESGHNSLPTPSHYRTQFRNMHPAGNAESNTEIYLNSGGRLSTGRLPQQTPSSQRQPIAHSGASSINRSPMSGYGISAGMRVGAQQEERSRIIHPLSQTHQQPHQPGDGFY